MHSFWLAFTTVCPLLLLLSFGMGLRKAGFLPPSVLTGLNNLCYTVFLPAVLFQNVYVSSFSVAEHAGLLLFATLSVLVAFALLSFIVPHIESRKDRRGVLIQGGLRSNFVLFGLPISNSIFGAEQAGTVALLIAFMVPLFNILSIIALERHRGEGVRWSGVLLGMIKNPLIIAGVAGICCAAFGVRFPAVLESTVLSVSQVATPLALIALGGSFSFSCTKDNALPLSGALLCKLVMMPAVCLTVAIFLGYRGIELGALLALYASPAAVSSFSMAEKLGGDGELAGQIVAVGSVVSIVTIFAAIAILESFGFLNA